MHRMITTSITCLKFIHPAATHTIFLAPLRSSLLVFLCLNFSFAQGGTTDVLGDGSGICAHWGDIGGNRVLLEQGGYRGHDHFTDIDRGTEAEMNEAVLNQVREWYKKNKGDVAGAGFYLTPDFFNSHLAMI